MATKQNLANNNHIEDSSDIKQRDVLAAAETGNLNLLQNLVEKDPTLLHVRDSDGYSPLHRASYNGHVRSVRYLLERGANVNLTTNDGWTPLHSACRWNNPACIRALLQNGANVNAVSQGGQTPLHLAAAYRENERMLQILLFHPQLEANLKNDAGDTALDVALRSGGNPRMFDIVSDSMNQV